MVFFCGIFHGDSTGIKKIGLNGGIFRACLRATIAATSFLSWKTHTVLCFSPKIIGKHTHNYVIYIISYHIILYHKAHIISYIYIYIYVLSYI